VDGPFFLWTGVWRDTIHSVKPMLGRADGAVMTETHHETPQTVGGGTAARSRADLLDDRAVKSGWLMVAIGVLVPLLALGGVFYGVQAARNGRRQAGYTLIFVGLLVFTVRMALYLR
jgi:hypothetical protein